jgi:hypothetical protein
MPRGGADALSNDDAGVTHEASLDPAEGPRKGVLEHNRFQDPSDRHPAIGGDAR